MKSIARLLLPSDWGDRPLLRSTAFSVCAGCTFWLIRAENWLGGDLAFVIASLVSLFAVYWIPPQPRQAYLPWLASHIPLLAGLYLIVLKVPRLLSGVVDYRLSNAVLLVVYCFGYYLLMRHQRTLGSSLQSHESSTDTRAESDLI